MKRNKAWKVLIICFLIGLGVGWLLLRRSRGDEAGRKDALVYADTRADFDPSTARPGEIDVEFKPGTSAGYVEALGRKLGVAFHPASDYVAEDEIYQVAVAPSDEESDIAALRDDPQVDVAEEDFVYAIPETALPADEEGLLDTQKPAPTDNPGKFTPNDPRFAEQWHMRQIHMEQAWTMAQGAGVIVAVVDTGVTKTSDLAGTEFVPGHNFVDHSDDARDDHGHGTHVAGTIAQTTHNGIGVAGVAYKAKIMPIKVLGASGGGSIAGIAEGIRWAADHGAKVINMSLGGPMASSLLGKAVKYAHDKGVVVVCAAGNDGRKKVSYPAAYPGAIAVAATQKDESTTFYSNWGKQIDIAAPGGNVRGDPTGGVLQNTLYQGRDDYFFFMGTSMASPHVAGVAALVVGAGVTDPDAVEAILKETARKPVAKTDESEYTLRYGAGIVDAAAAVKRAQAKNGGAALGFGAGLALLVVSSLRRRRLLAGFGLGGALGVVIGASGLFFLRPDFFGASLVTHGFAEWGGQLLGASHAGNPILWSALGPLAVAALVYGRSRLQGLGAGFALGVAGSLLAVATLHTVTITTMPWPTLWLVGNALFCAFLAWALARK